MSSRLQFRRYRLPFRAPLRTAHGRWAEREGLLVQLADAAGVTGYGEAAPIPWFGTETVDEAAAACRDLGEIVDDARLDALPARVACLRNALASAQGAFADGAAPVGHQFIGVAALLPAGRPALDVI